MSIFSPVETAFLARSGKASKYEAIEQTHIIEVENVYELGKIVALRFLEWVQQNPSGIVALPTGRTPEYFIKTLDLLRNTWKSEATQTDISELGFSSCTEFPDMSNLKFAM